MSKTEKEILLFTNKIMDEFIVEVKKAKLMYILSSLDIDIIKSLDLHSMIFIFSREEVQEMFSDIISQYVVNYHTFKKKDRELFESFLLSLYDQAFVFFTHK